MIFFEIHVSSKELNQITLPIFTVLPLCASNWQKLAPGNISYIAEQKRPNVWNKDTSRNTLRPTVKGLI